MTSAETTPPLRQAIDSGDVLECRETYELVDIYICGALAVLLHKGTRADRHKVLGKFLYRRFMKLEKMGLKGSTAHHTCDTLLRMRKNAGATTMLRTFETWYVTFFGVVPYPYANPIRRTLRVSKKIVEEDEYYNA